MSEPRRLFLHVGLQKTGTSFLQAALLRSRERLAAHGLDVVPPTKQQCFELMVVLRNRYQDHRDPRSDQNTLDRFVAQLAEASGSRAVYSQESMAAMSPAQVERLLALVPDREVHVVLTVRDLARQLPSSWQQELKAGGVVDLPAYLERLRECEQHRRARNPWIHLEPPAVAARWAKALAPDRIHLVTVPPRGESAALLPERFARVLGIDADLLEPEEHPVNFSLGYPQAEFLRRVNADLPELAHRRHLYRDVVKIGFAAQILAPQHGRRILVPERYRDWCESVTERQVDELTAAGYAIEGTLADLAVTEEVFGPADDAPGEAEVAAAAAAAAA
ncbi:MAG: sulfotransferase, partial [Nocardioides sp.]|uniref:hypothetical protein n=1 Tax=Nocardioides sp. TaxID=35761 RepID=UPI0039E476FB